MKDAAASKTKGLAWLSIGFILAALFAFGLSPLAKIVPWSWEKKLGKVLDDSSEEKLVDNPKAKLLLQKIIHRIYPVDSNDKDFSIKVEIVKSKEVNAYTGLGGKILINSALINQAESPEEMAAIIAHEIEHARNRHVLEGLLGQTFTTGGVKMIFSGGTSLASSLSEYLFNMNFTRSQEIIADKGALLRLQKGHVNNQGFKRFFERAGESDSLSAFLSDHPSNQVRLKMADNFNNKNVKPIMSLDEWKALKKYCAGN